MKIIWVKEYLENLWYNICFISIYGSQNYCLDIYEDDYKSDYDYKAVCIPSLEDLVNQTKPVSKTLEFQWWQIDLKDIRLFTENLCKANPVNIETCYSDFTWASEEFSEIITLWKQLPFDLMPLFVKWAYWQALEKVKAFSHPYPSLVDKIEKFWYDPKQLCHIIRLEKLCRILEIDNEVQFKLNWRFRDELIDIKKWWLLLKYAIDLRDSKMEDFLMMRNRADKREMKFDNKYKIIELSKQIIINSITNLILNNKNGKYRNK